MFSAFITVMIFLSQLMKTWHLRLKYYIKPLLKIIIKKAIFNTEIWTRWKVCLVPVKSYFPKGTLNLTNEPHQNPYPCFLNMTVWCGHRRGKINFVMYTVRKHNSNALHQKYKFPNVAFKQSFAIVKLHT